MLLNSIKVSGFKSFAEEVELILEPGITTIVGPNGCGKSNVSDAIRWVLGEQSARALRCTNMRDLLFNGGANFSPSQRASVALTFTNISENLSIESPEVEVRRQLTRDGESSYLINQTPCRLRDISELFMDTGVGVDAYSVMEQSKIDLILNVRPEERRFLFDEVAGITKYKVRKKSAIQKLKDTEQNLVRINDIIQELQRETESLKAQAEQAGHYQSLKDQLQQLELGLAYRDYEKLATDYRETQSNLEAILNEVSDANQILQEADERIENATLRRTELDAAITTAQEEIREIEGQLEKVERQIVIHKENQLNIQQQKQRAEQTLESLNSQQVNLQTRNRERTQEKKRLEASYKIEESRLTAKQQHLQELSSRIDKTKESIQEAQTDLQEISTELSQRENRRIAIEHELTSKQSSLNNLQESSNALKTELKAATDDRDEIQRGATQLDAELLQIGTKKKQVETTLNENQDALRKIESEIRGLEENLGGSLSRYKSLEQLQSAYEGYYAGVRAIMRAKDHFPDQFAGICDVVAELIDTDTEYEVAIEVALGSAIQNVVTETAEDADTAISFLKKHRAGRVTFLPIDILRRRTFSDDALLDEPGVIGIADELVGYDDKYEKIIQHLLGNTLVLENLDAAVALTRKFRHNARLVTLEGELINTSGAITGGHTDQRKSGLLSRANELDVLKTKIGELQQIVNQKDEKRKAYAATIAEADQTRQRLTGHLQDKQIEKASITKDIEQADQNIDRLNTELAEVETQNRQLKETVDLSREDQQTLDAEIAELTKKRTQTEGRIQRVSEQVGSDARKREEVVSDCQEREIFLAGQRQKLESMTEELDNFDEQQLQIEKNIEEQQAIIDSDEQTKHDIAGQIEEAQRQFLRIGGDRAEAEAAHDELTEEREALLEEIETIQKEMRNTRKQFESQNRKQRQLEVKTTQLEMQLKSISTRILDKYQVSIDEIPKPTVQDEVSEHAEQSTVPAILELDEIDLMDNIEKLKAEISAMGAVNLKAIEAHEEHKKRLDFQIDQRDDIQQSIQSMHQAIQKINETSRDVFMKTFDQVKINFQEVFTQLFGGGETELRLTDEANILESGIDIIACPPGKRPQSITQLSGGERSLVAIGLLFAVFKIKPSPFCVLDEVDAALDEANVLRFTNLIRDYSDNTQFVIITHNNRTMEISDVMYGVTMEQAGMSKIVTYKFAA
ncbi:MAG: chromosome segregation protein SMC [Candidatus Poribacteria bacterium]|nr:chromosome segregation protein SMC [Candidatus Poribacteria bacterium]